MFDWALFAILLAACGAASSTGAMFPPDQWYETLDKPAWTPPNWVFPVVWSTLYILIAVAGTRAFLVEDAHYGAAFWALQLVLNALWSPIFFGLKRIRAGLFAVAALWLSVLATLLAFWPLDTIAAVLFVPYLLWVTIAAALNLSVLRRNPQAVPT